jgi:hypothetical protein
MLEDGRVEDLTLLYGEAAAHAREAYRDVEEIVHFYDTLAELYQVVPEDILQTRFPRIHEKVSALKKLVEEQA